MKYVRIRSWQLRTFFKPVLKGSLYRMAGSIKFCCLVLMFRSSSNTQIIRTVNTVRDLGFFLNTGFSAEDNVTHTASLSRVTVECFFPLSDPWRPFSLIIFLPLYEGFIQLPSPPCASRTHLQGSPTAVSHPTSPTSLLSNPVLEYTTSVDYEGYVGA